MNNLTKAILVGSLVFPSLSFAGKDFNCEPFYEHQYGKMKLISVRIVHGNPRTFNFSMLQCHYGKIDRNDHRVPWGFTVSKSTSLGRILIPHTPNLWDKIGSLESCRIKNHNTPHVCTTYDKRYKEPK